MATNSPSSAVVNEVLRMSNYANWSACMRNYLLGQGLWDIVQGTTESNEDTEADSEASRKKNAMALHAIQISCSPDVLSEIRDIDSAKDVWEHLRRKSVPPLKRPPFDFKEILADQLKEEHLDLLQGVYCGDLGKVKEFLDRHPDAVRTKVTGTGASALHIAAATGRIEILEEWLKLTPAEDMELLRDQFGQTVLTYAAFCKNPKVAKCVVKKKKNLVSIDFPPLVQIPVVVSSSCGHKDTTRYLYSVTPRDDLTGEKSVNGATLLTHCIITGILDVALDLLQHCPPLAFAVNIYQHSTLTLLAQMPSLFPSGNQLAFWQQWIYSCWYTSATSATSASRAYNDTSVRIPMSDEDESEGENTIGVIDEGGNIITQVRSQFYGLILKSFGINQIYDRKQIHIQTRDLISCISKGIRTLDISQASQNLESIFSSVVDAIKHGIFELVVEIISCYPLVTFGTDKEGKDIFSLAILHRQGKIFSLIYDLDADSMKYITSRVNFLGNNMLHTAGMLAPSSQLDRISGAALQMQRELQWFKELEGLVQPMYKELSNIEGKTPREVFTESHKDLVKEGEKWMKDTATSCTVVAALIVTIVFAAAFSIPDSTNAITHTSIFLEDKLFRVFIISDTLSLFSSSTSVLMFLGILTSRYAAEDFLRSLPTKLIIGLSTLFFSIATMMITFTAAIFIMLKEHYAWVFIPVILLASVPITLFGFLQFPLLVEIFISTYVSDIFDKKTKHWWKNIFIKCSQESGRFFKS